MHNFRYIGIQKDGRIIRGAVSSSTKRSARVTVRLLEEKYAFRVQKIIPEQVFLYRAQRMNEKPFIGEQKAFERSDVEAALRKLGYRVIFVRRRLIPFHLKPSSKDIVVFVRICADLLRDKLPFDEILQILSTDTENKTLKNALRDIRTDLKEGREGASVFGRHRQTFGKFPAYMLGIATTSGDMAAVYDSTARFMERNEEFKKSLRQALLMPAVVSIFMAAAVVFYVAYIFPKTAELFTKFDIDLPPMTAATLLASAFLRDNIVTLSVAAAAGVTGIVLFFRSTRGRFLFDKYVIRLPYVGGLLHKTSIEIFARVFHALYSESGDNIQVIRTAAEACRNTYMESRINTVAVPLMLKEGRGLVESLEAAGVFTKTALSRFRSGSEAGALKSAALQLANYYEKETVYRLKGFIDWVNVSVSVVTVLVVIVLTIVSSETAVIHPKMPGLNY